MSNIRKNYFYNVIYQILNIFLPIFTVPYLSRVMGAEQIGIYSYTSSIANYFGLFAMLGVCNYGSRAIALARNNNDKELLNKTFWSIYGLQFLSSMLSIFMYIFFCCYLKKKIMKCR